MLKTRSAWSRPLATQPEAVNSGNTASYPHTHSDAQHSLTLGVATPEGLGALRVWKIRPGLALKGLSILLLWALPLFFCYCLLHPCFFSCRIADWSLLRFLWEFGQSIIFAQIVMVALSSCLVQTILAVWFSQLVKPRWCCNTVGPDSAVVHVSSNIPYC